MLSGSLNQNQWTWSLKQWVFFRFPSQALPRSGSKRVFLSRIFGSPKTLGTPNGYLLSNQIPIF